MGKSKRAERKKKQANLMNRKKLAKLARAKDLEEDTFQDGISINESTHSTSSNLATGPSDSSNLESEENYSGPKSRNNKPSYSDVTANSNQVLVSNVPRLSSFTLAKSLYDKSKVVEDSVGSDDITVEHGLPSQSQRMSVMISVPDKDVDEDDAPFEAIKKLNNMISCLINKVPSVRIGPWNNDKK